ncbi:MAG: nucleoside hydrolase [Tunicatimonas sp.]
MRLLLALLCAFSVVPATISAQSFPQLPEAQRLAQLQPPSGPVTAVLDTDTYNEIDDQFALVYALLSPEQMTIEAIYAAPFLNDRSASAADGMEKSYEEILRLLDKMKRPAEGLVHRGSAGFLESLDKPLESDATRDLIRRAQAAEGPLYVLTVGAPTNVASALLLEPSIVNKIVVVWLGGKGLNWPSASEFNLQQDVLASQVLFDSGVPLIQLPTEPVTSHLLTTVPEVETYLAGKGEIGDYLVQIFKDYHQDHFAWSKVIWDISAVAYLIDATWFKTEVRSTPLLTDELTYRFDDSRPPYRVATYVRRDPVYQDMFRKIEKAF